ncbi:MAG: hypothetical protein QM723_33435 [Myxococcaceae bacterium]
MCAFVVLPAWAQSAPKREPLSKTPHPGTYKLTRWSLNGNPAEPTLPTLTLKADGEYAFGTAKGQWRVEDTGVALLGPYSHWGNATVRASGDELVFAYTRGAAHFEVVMTREGEQASR